MLLPSDCVKPSPWSHLLHVRQTLAPAKVTWKQPVIKPAQKKLQLLTLIVHKLAFSLSSLFHRASKWKIGPQKSTGWSKEVLRNIAVFQKLSSLLLSMNGGLQSYRPPVTPKMSRNDFSHAP